MSAQTDEEGTRWPSNFEAESWLECVPFWSIRELETEARKVRARVLERNDDGVYLRMAATPDERYIRGQFQLHPEDGAAVLAALDARVPDGTLLRDWDHASARALVEMAKDGGGGKSVKPVVLVSVSQESLVGQPGADTIGAINHGMAYLNLGTIERLLCDGRVQALLTDEDGKIIETGSMSQHIPQYLANAVLERDGGVCNHPECDRDKYLEIHHVIFRSHGGPTEFWNLRPLCWEHHDDIHNRGWKLVHTGGGNVQWIRPDGTSFDTS